METKLISIINSPVLDSDIKEVIINLDGTLYSGLIMPKIKIQNGK
jgi:hypothetical protein